MRAVVLKHEGKTIIKVYSSLNLMNLKEAKDYMNTHPNKVVECNSGVFEEVAMEVIIHGDFN